jgi:4'-phosphopantetheinyl transferase
MAIDVRAVEEVAPLLDRVQCDAPLRLFDGAVTVRRFDRRRCHAGAADLDAVLTDDDRQVLGAMGHPLRREARTFARALLRLTLSAATHDTVEPSGWTFARGLWGKPRAEAHGAPGPSFSLSYGAEALAIAVATPPPGAAGDLGVDLEPARPERSADIPWRELSERERRQVQDLAPDERFEAFVRMWTLKEAFTKCLGVGASLDFDRVETSLRPPRVRSRPTDDARGRSFQFHQQRVAVGGRRQILAVAWSERG